MSAFPASVNEQIWKHRGRLEHTLTGLNESRLTVGFIGGSITDGRSAHNWPEPVMNWFAETFPTCRFRVENAAIGATGSALAVFRAERDLIDRHCDLVFVEFAVNDFGIEADQRKQSREGLVRKLLADGRRDVVFVYTFLQGMYEEMYREQVPASIAEFEQIAEHYRVGSVWMGKYSFEEIRRGRMRWEEWLPDSLHPTHRGSLSYAQSAIRFLENELCRHPDAGLSDEQRMLSGERLPAPLHPRHWQYAYRFDLAAIETQGPWLWKRSTKIVWMDLLLSTAGIGARLTFSFHGRGIALGFDFGATSADFNYAIDGGEWVAYRHNRPPWIQPEGWFKCDVIEGNLPDGEHRMIVEVIHGDRPECKGTNFHLALVGIIP